MRGTACACAVVMAMLAGPVAARDNFDLTLTVNGETGFRSFTSIEDAYNSLSTGALQSIVSGYTDQSAATVQLNLRGVPATGLFAANSPALRVIIPGPGIDVTFNGATRDESRRLFEDWLKGQGASQVNALLRYAVRTTPIDPVAGNPGAAMNQFVASDFGRSVEAATGGGTGLALGIRFGAFSAAGFNTRSLSVPINQSFALTPRDTVEFDLPLTWSDTGGAYSYGANIGVLYRRRVIEGEAVNWTLQPSFRIGGVGSYELGAASGIYSLALNSTLQFGLPWDLRLTVANAITRIATFGVSVGGFGVDYDLKNTVFRNGLILTRDLGFSIRNLPVQASAFFVDTRFTGDAVYIRNYQEFGVFAQAGRESPARVGVTVLTGDRGVSGFFINTGVEF